MTDSPLLMIYDGTRLVPATGWGKRVEDQLTVGAKYFVEVRHERSEASHRHYFCALSEAFANLPEDAAERFANVEALRKFALIRTGWRDERSIACPSKAEAARVAAFLRPMDDMAIVTVSEAVVTVYTAKSQSFKAMGKDAFQRSKDDCLNYVASLIGTTPDALRKERAA